MRWFRRGFVGPRHGCAACADGERGGSGDDRDVDDWSFLGDSR